MDVASDFNIEEIKKEIAPWKRIFDFLHISNNVQMKASYFSKICGLCLVPTVDKRLLSQFRYTGYQRLNQFIKKLSKQEVQLLDCKLLISCCLSLLSYYQDCLANVPSCYGFKLNRRLGRVKVLYCNVVSLEMPERQKDVIRACMNYLTRTEQWDQEDLINFVLQELLAMVPKQEMVLSQIIKLIERSQREGELEQAHTITSSLVVVLENIHWDKYQFNRKLFMCFNTMLKLYLINDINASRSKGLIIIMDSMSQILSDPEVTEDDRSDLIEMIVFCAQRLHTRIYRESLTPNLLDFLLSYLKSDYRNSAMSSQRIFQYLLDRHGNQRFFMEPIYYFKGRSNFTVNVNYSRDDVHFFKSFSQEFFSGIHKCLIRFTETTTLVMSFTTMCLVLVEIPDPVTTINIIHVVIRTQNDFLKNKRDYNLVTKSHIHAIVASILSLICLIHEDEVTALGKYVQEVVSYRNENSPHLLPPLSPQYSIAGHHTTDYHHQLYFLEEEVLYALKQCWLGRRRSN